MAAAQPLIVLDDLTGGRNDTDPPTKLQPNQVQEALNIDYYRGKIANKRQGATALSTTFSAGGPFTSFIGSLIRYVPDAAETAAELWAADAASVIGRLAGATTWTAPSLKDALTTGATDVTGTSLGGFLHLNYTTGQNRSHVWDASLSKVRRTGLATPAAAPTGATDGGAGLTFSRVYRVRWVDVSGSTVRRMSEASATLSASITDDAGYTVTRPTAASEDETHWDLEAADTTAGPFYRIARTAIATTTFDDTSASISTTNLSPADGINYPPPAWKWTVADDNRIVGTGCFETSGGYVTASNKRVWFTPVLGSSDIGDCERIPSGNYITLEEATTGIGGPIQGSIYVFGYRRIWKLTPTGIDSRPYSRITIARGIGCIRHQSIVMAEDEQGNPALYFMSHRGPYRLGINGLQYLGRDSEILWATINLAATTGVPAHGIYHTDKHQLWYWIATGSNNDPETKLVFDTRLGRVGENGDVRGGWVKHDGNSALARCSCMFANTVGASMSADLKPYIGQAGAANRIWKCDSTATDDAGTAFQAYIHTAELLPAGYARRIAVNSPYLIAKTASGVTITVTAYTDFSDASTATGTLLLTASGSETRTQDFVQGLQTASVGSVAYRIGDGSAVSNQWTLDALVATYTPQEML